jgi:hypothetical protein
LIQVSRDAAWQLGPQPQRSCSYAYAQEAHGEIGDGAKVAAILFAIKYFARKPIAVKQQQQQQQQQHGRVHL